MTIRAKNYQLLLHFDDNLADSGYYNISLSESGTQSFVSRSKWGRYLRFYNGMVYGQLHKNRFPGEFSLDFWYQIRNKRPNYLFGDVFIFESDEYDVLKIKMKNSSGLYPLIVNHAINDYSWLHIAISRDETFRLRIHVNGGIVYSNIVNWEIYNSTGHILKDDRTTGSGTYFWIDEYRLLDKCPDEYKGNSFSVPTVPYTLPEDTNSFRPWLFQNQILN